jgi:energy-coupling factor transport system permease protein
VVSASGVVVVATMVGAGMLGAPGMQYPGSPLGPPSLPLLAAIGILVGLVPAWAAPVEQQPLAAPDGANHPIGTTRPPVEAVA